MNHNQKGELFMIQGHGAFKQSDRWSSHNPFKKKKHELIEANFNTGHHEDLGVER